MKKMLNRQQMLLIGLVIAGLFFLQACAGMPFKSPEEALRQRVDTMMNAKTADDWGTVYDLMDSSYRKRMTKENFLKINREMRFSNYRFDSLEIHPSGDMAEVKVKYDMSVKVFDFKDQVETQQWVREWGRWYLKAEKSKDVVTPMD
ncbi:MAG: hypothetical protein C4548_16970 [Desulfobacteraceae bacterium]|jgi:hypothetical protein|nr:MAG: hypothetical protein C4548_16970 [Desulfobacteraceae bacterium]